MGPRARDDATVPRAHFHDFKIGRPSALLSSRPVTSRHETRPRLRAPTSGSAICHLPFSCHGATSHSTRDHKSTTRRGCGPARGGADALEAKDPHPAARPHFARKARAREGGRGQAALPRGPTRHEPGRGLAQETSPQLATTTFSFLLPCYPASLRRPRRSWRRPPSPSSPRRRCRRPRPS